MSTLSYEELSKYCDSLVEDNVQLEKDFQGIKAHMEVVQEELLSLRYPERSILVVTHEEETAEQYGNVLQMLYESAMNNRLAFSEVKLDDDTTKMALCGIVPTEDETKGNLQLYPIFLIQDVLDSNSSLRFPTPDKDTWLHQEPIEAPLTVS